MVGREVKATLYEGNDDYYVLVLRDKPNLTNFYIGRNNYGDLEHCFGIPDQPERLADSEYVKVCLSDYTCFVEELTED